MHRFIALAATNCVYLVREFDIVAMHFVRIDTDDRAWKVDMSLFHMFALYKDVCCSPYCLCNFLISFV